MGKIEAPEARSHESKVMDAQCSGVADDLRVGAWRSAPTFEIDAERSLTGGLLRTTVKLQGLAQSGTPIMFCMVDSQVAYVVQFSTSRPFTRAKSFTLLVTTVAPIARACAAIMRSAAPSWAPRFFKSVRISA